MEVVKKEDYTEEQKKLIETYLKDNPEANEKNVSLVIKDDETLIQIEQEIEINQPKEDEQKHQINIDPLKLLINMLQQNVQSDTKIQYGYMLGWYTFNVNFLKSALDFWSKEENKDKKVEDIKNPMSDYTMKILFSIEQKVPWLKQTRKDLNLIFPEHFEKYYEEHCNDLQGGPFGQPTEIVEN